MVLFLLDEFLAEGGELFEVLCMVLVGGPVILKPGDRPGPPLFNAGPLHQPEKSDI